MQIHQLQINHKQKDKKRIGRGGKRGTYSGHGVKGQKSRAGARIRPGFRGGDNPIWKLFPKQRGANKKVDIKHRSFKLAFTKPIVVNLGLINDTFKEGDIINPKMLIKRGLVRTNRRGVKVLGAGQLSKKFTFNKIEFSSIAKEKALKAGCTIN